MSVRMPNFFIAGVANAGTTALHSSLGQHPQVFMSPVKEPTFFGAGDALNGRYGDTTRRHVEQNHAMVRRHVTRSKLGSAAAAGAALAWSEYLDLFREARDQVAIGEASVRYFRLAGAAAAIRDRVPRSRVIVVLRDPAERLYSRYVRSHGRVAAMPFRSWFSQASVSGSRWEEPVDEGRYATHLVRFFAAFPRDQLRVYLYDDYQADGPGLLKDILTFLGVDSRIPIDVSRRHNETLAPRFLSLHTLRRRALGMATAPRWVPAPARRALRWLYYRGRPTVTMDAADRRMVIDFYRDEIERASELIGRDLSAWLQ